MWKWIIIIVIGLYILPIFIDLLKSKDRKKFVRNLTKKEKVILGTILILVVIVIPSYLIGKNIMFKNKIKETVEKSEIYKYVDSYELSGFKNSTTNLNVNDGFDKLDDNVKLKYTKAIYDSVNSTILTYGDISDDRDTLMKLVNDHKVVIKASEGVYSFEYDSLKKPDGKEIKEVKNNSTESSDSNITIKSYNNDKTLQSGQSITLNKDTLVCSSRDTLDKMLSFLNANNKEAASNMLLNGQATMLKKGTKVNVIDSGIIVTQIETLDGSNWFAPRETIQAAL